MADSDKFHGFSKEVFRACSHYPSTVINRAADDLMSAERRPNIGNVNAALKRAASNQHQSNVELPNGSQARDFAENLIRIIGEPAYISWFMRGGESTISGDTTIFVCAPLDFHRQEIRKRFGAELIHLASPREWVFTD